MRFGRFGIGLLHPHRNTPDSMVGAWEARWTDIGGTRVGSNAMLEPELAVLPYYCRIDMEDMDSYCHQYGVVPGTTDTPKFADYTELNVAGDATCDGWTDGEEQVHCLGQACMFDYCIY